MTHAAIQMNKATTVTEVFDVVGVIYIVTTVLLSYTYKIFVSVFLQHSAVVHCDTQAIPQLWFCSHVLLTTRYRSTSHTTIRVEYTPALLGIWKDAL